jgi:hypothetical protein
MDTKNQPTLRDHLIATYDAAHHDLLIRYASTGDQKDRLGALLMGGASIKAIESKDPIMDKPYFQTPGIRVDIIS